MKFVQLAKSLTSLAPVYLIEGEETYFRDHAVKSIRAACEIANPSLNETRIDGETLKGDRLSSLPDVLNALPFMDARRLVRIYEFYPTEREWGQIEGYIKDPCATTVLLIVNSKPNKRVDLKKRQGIVYVDCGKETEEMLSRWLFGVCKRAQLSIDGDAVSLMVRYCNLDASRMRTEVDKLVFLLGAGGRITADTVREHVAKDVEYKMYELTQAASRGNFSLFSEILTDVMAKGSDENVILSALLSHFRTLLEIGTMRASDAEIGKALGIKPYAVQKNREAAAKLGKDRVEALYSYIYEQTAKMRSGLCSKSGALWACVAKIFYG